MNPFNLYRSTPKREQLAVPERGKPDRTPGISSPPPVSVPTPKPQSISKPKRTKKPESTEDLAKQREYFGFDDIPTDEDPDMSGVRFRDIFKAWGKQSVKDSELEKKLKNGKTRLGRLKRISNDVKWALQADLDEPVEPHEPHEPPKKPKTPAPDVPSIISSRPQFPTDVTSSPTGADKTIDINISFGNLPKITRPKLPSKATIKAKTRKLLANKKVVAIGGIIIIVGIAGSVLAYNLQANNAKQASSDTPTYTTITPADKTAGAVTWKRVSPPHSDAVFAYADKIDSVAIMVSQQQLPNSFKDDPEGKIGELAKGFGATSKIDADNIKVYLGASSEGPQSVIFVKDNLLVLMKSQSKISNDGWVNYIKTLN